MDIHHTEQAEAFYLQTREKPWHDLRCREDEDSENGTSSSLQLGPSVYAHNGLRLCCVLPSLVLQIPECAAHTQVHSALTNIVNIEKERI